MIQKTSSLQILSFWISFCAILVFLDILDLLTGTLENQSDQNLYVRGSSRNSNAIKVIIHYYYYLKKYTIIIIRIDFRSRLQRNSEIHPPESTGTR